MLIQMNPVTPGRRGKWIVQEPVWRKGPATPLCVGKRATGGRNHHGTVTLRWRGGGVKRRLRTVNWHRFGLPSTVRVCRIERDPNRTAFLALVRGGNRLSYLLAPQDISVGQFLLRAPTRNRLLSSKFGLGSQVPLKTIPPLTQVHAIQPKPHSDTTLVRAAGTGARILRHLAGYTLLKLPSKQFLLLNSSCLATTGIVSNPNHRFEMVGKAGGWRVRGFRPHVRGEAMNAVDHPNGGKTKCGRHSKTAWGKLAYGPKTRRRFGSTYGPHGRILNIDQAIHFLLLPTRGLPISSNG